MSNKTPKKFLNFINTVDKEEFIKCYKNSSKAAIMEKYSISSTLAYKILDYWGITKNDSFRRKDFLNSIEKKSKNINKKDFIQYYMDHNIEQTREYFNLTPAEFRYFKNKFNISKSSKDITKTRELNILREHKDRDTYYKEVNNKRFNTFKNNYGSVEEAYDIIHKKAKNTLILNYGCDNSIHVVGATEKRTETWRNKTPEEKKEIWDKKFQTILKNSNGNLKLYYQQASEKAKITIAQDPNYYTKRLEKYKQTSLERYGVENYNYLEECTEKRRKKFIETYGSLDKLYLERTNKAYITKKKNGTFNTSKPEKLLFNFLINIYGEENVKNPYKDERYIREDGYKYECDFYIKPLDLFIEYNGTWQHGPKPFNLEDEECKALLEKWELKSLNSKTYKYAIRTWTITDVNKLKIAEKNNLNYLVIYNKNVFKYLGKEMDLPLYSI